MIALHCVVRLNLPLPTLETFFLLSLRPNIERFYAASKEREKRLNAAQQQPEKPARCWVVAIWRAVTAAEKRCVLCDSSVFCVKNSVTGLQSHFLATNCISLSLHRCCGYLWAKYAVLLCLFLQWTPMGGIRAHFSANVYMHGWLYCRKKTSI